MGESYRQALDEGYAARNAGRSEDASRAFQRAASLASNGGERATAQVHAALALSALRRPDEAQPLFRAVVDSAVASPDERAMSLLNLGWIAGGRGQQDEAQRWFEQARVVAGAPPEPICEAQIQLAWCRHARKDYERAIPEFRQALSMPGLARYKEAECHWAIAGALLGLGRKSETREALEKVLSIPEANPDWVAGARRILSQP